MEEMEILRLFYEEKDLVVSSVRQAKSISKVPENITVVTAREIEAMNAHTVAEILDRVSGVFVEFNRDFGAVSLISIQGSEQRHVLILVDGLPWNLMAEGSAETNSIPVGIIERIEIVRGPASSAWGSSLGGVINILTKSAGEMTGPNGAIEASFGEKNSTDYSAQIKGLLGSVGYYLFAGGQESDGLRSSREFSSRRIYAKLRIPFSQNVILGVNAGYSKPENDLGDYPSGDVATAYENQSLYYSAHLDVSLAESVSVNLTAYRIEHDFSVKTDTLGLGMLSPTEDFFSDNSGNEQTTGTSAKLAWTKGRHSGVVGVDADWGDIEQTIRVGPLYQLFGVPAASSAKPSITKWAIYANDTISFDGLSLTAGIRYDDNSIAGSFLSPSLGLTYRLGKNTLARAFVARGFTQPPLSWTSAGGLFLDPNPSLKHESIWSYQASVESSAISRLWLKAALFYHDLDDEIMRKQGAAGAPTFNDLFINSGNIRRKGFEIEGETASFHHLSAALGISYVAIEDSSDEVDRDRYKYNVRLSYDDSERIQAQLLGYYIWWDRPEDTDQRREVSDFIWDLNVSARILENRRYAAKVFLSARNILDGHQYAYVDNKNPKRWFEGGIKVEF